jgi:CheY-like chemotaxis protein
MLVLLVEDHPLNRKLFRDILEMQFSVAEAGSAEEARTKLQTLTPSLILMDVHRCRRTTYARLKADPRG